MDSIELIRAHLERSQERVLANIEDMREHALVFPTPNGGGHTLWVLGHLAYIEALVIQRFMLGEPNPLAEWKDAFDGDAPTADASRYPEFDRVLAACRAGRQRTLTLLDSQEESDLDRASAAAPSGFEDTFGTRRLCLWFIGDHGYMHRGQLADARRATGIDRMWL